MSIFGSIVSAIFGTPKAVTAAVTGGPAAAAPAAATSAAATASAAVAKPMTKDEGDRLFYEAPHAGTCNEHAGAQRYAN